MREEWEGLLTNPPPKPAHQISLEVPPDIGKSSDTYCYELLSMLIGLSQSTVGCAFLSEQEKLVQDLFALLHVGTVRLQLQVQTVCICDTVCVSKQYLYPTCWTACRESLFTYSSAYNKVKGYVQLFYV